MQRLGLMLLVTGGFSLPAVAQNASTGQPDAFLYTAQAALLLLGMAFAGYWAYAAFDTPPIKLGDGPTLPRYMTQPAQYRLGVLVYVGACLMVYALIAYFHRDLLPLVGALMPELYQTIQRSMTNGSLTYPLVVIFSAAIFVSLLKVAIVLAGGWMLLQQQGPRLDLLYYLVAGSTVIGALTLGIVFAFRPPNRRVLMLSG